MSYAKIKGILFVELQIREFIDDPILEQKFIDDPIFEKT